MTTISTNGYRIPAAHLGASNTLPVFRLKPATPGTGPAPSASMSADETINTLDWSNLPVLPYLVQDDYDRTTIPRTLPAITIRNKFLRAILLPGLGGRLVSLVDLRDGRELLFRNPVFQPANLAILNAWFSGGVEWNGLTPGHTPVTCSPVFAAVIATDRGPVIRLYEFDRIREATWQVDLFLPDDDARLWVHGRICNPNPRPVRAYWWTNIAAPLTPRTRVFSPADYTIEHVPPDGHLDRAPFPGGRAYDGSYPALYPYAASVFFRQPDNRRPWIAAVDGTGRGFAQFSTATMVGRKLFVFGNHPGGQRWMDFLARPGEGAYIEIQAGLMPTQNQEFILPANGTIEWTEAFMPFHLNPAAAHDPDYRTACAAAEAHLHTLVDETTLAEMDRWMSLQSTIPPQSVVSRGAAWGDLHAKMTGCSFGTGLNFAAIPDAEKPWAELLETGAFSPATLAQPPSSWVTSERWERIIVDSAASHGATWFHELALGVIRLQRGFIDEAVAHFTRSHELKANPIACRNLAIIACRQGRNDDAMICYRQAWTLAGNNTALAVEICRFLQETKRDAELARFLAELPAEVARHERIQLALGLNALRRKEYATLRQILAGDFASIREGETLLTDLWFTLHVREEELRLGRALTGDESKAVIQTNPPPTRLDFRMNDAYTLLT